MYLLSGSRISSMLDLQSSHSLWNWTFLLRTAHCRCCTVINNKNRTTIENNPHCCLLLFVNDCMLCNVFSENSTFSYQHVVTNYGKKLSIVHKAFSCTYSIKTFWDATHCMLLFGIFIQVLGVQHVLKNSTTDFQDFSALTYIN